jgi:transposase-like protein
MEGLKNFCGNIKETMLKLHRNEDITEEEKKRIVQFYLEVTSVVMSQKFSVAEETI